MVRVALMGALALFARQGCCPGLFKLKYVFLAGKIIRTARSVVMKLSEEYLYQEIYEKKSVLEKYPLHMFQPVVTI